MMGADIPRELSGPLARLARVIGTEKTLRLAAAFRDEIFRIPVRARANHPWLSVLTAAELDAVCSSPLARQVITFPMSPNRGDKKPLILDLAEQGQQPKEIAQKVGCSRRYVQRVMRGFRTGSGLVGGAK